MKVLSVNKVPATEKSKETLKTEINMMISEMTVPEANPDNFKKFRELAKEVHLPVSAAEGNLADASETTLLVCHRVCEMALGR